MTFRGIAVTVPPRRIEAHLSSARLTIGAVIGRHLLRLDGLHDAAPERITALLQHGD